MGWAILMWKTARGGHGRTQPPALLKLAKTKREMRKTLIIAAALAAMAGPAMAGKLCTLDNICTDRAAEDSRKAVQNAERDERARRVGVEAPTATASLPFAEVFPTDAVDAECAKHGSPFTGMCVDTNQAYYNYDRAMWTSLRPGRRQFCITAAEKFRRGIGFYHLLETCLENEVR